MRTKLAFVATLVFAALVGGAALAQQPAGSAAPAAGSAAPAAAAPAAAGSAAPTAAAPAAAAPPAAGSAAPAAAAPAAAGSAAPAAAAPAAAGSAAPAAAAPAAGSGSAAAPAAGSAAPAAAAPAAGTAAPAAKAGPKPPTWYEELANRPWDTSGTFWMPKSVNKAASGTDTMFYATLGLSIFCFFGILGVTVYFVIRYRHRPGHKAEPSAAHNDSLEITWTIIPTIIVVFLFLFGWRDYIEMVTPPQKAVEIQVLAQKWNWSFTHSNGVSDNVLYVPVNTPVRMVMTSKDVIHSFYVPAFRIKQDVVPGRFTFAWFYATKPGTYRLYCAEYCGGEDTPPSPHPKYLGDGSGHSQMKTVVVVLEPGLYEKYLADAADTSTMSPVDLGRKLYEKKGCIGCHSTDGTIKVGPSWLHDYGTKATMNDGQVITVDENYIRESILSPQAKSRPGFPPSMPSFEGQLKDRDIQAIIAYFKSLQ